VAERQGHFSKAKEPTLLERVQTVQTSRFRAQTDVTRVGNPARFGQFHGWRCDLAVYSPISESKSSSGPTENAARLGATLTPRLRR
jgi:hypothetical protein